jgi:hypothetical protein
VCSGAGCTEVAHFIDQDEFVTVRNEPEAGVISCNFDRPPVWIDAPLRGGLDVSILRPANSNIRLFT